MTDIQFARQPTDRETALMLYGFVSALRGKFSAPTTEALFAVLLPASEALGVILWAPGRGVAEKEESA